MQLKRIPQRDALDIARAAAIEAANRSYYGTATADDAYAGLMLEGITPASLGHAAGAIFATPDWTKTQERVASRRRSNNGRRIQVWELM